jgi:hypothetical protein
LKRSTILSRPRHQALNLVLGQITVGSYRQVIGVEGLDVFEELAIALDQIVGSPADFCRFEKHG